MRRIISLLTDIYSRLRMQYKIRPKTVETKLNLGCGLAVCRGWINIDASLNILAAKLPGSCKKIFYRLSGAKDHFSFSDYRDILKRNSFVFQDLKYGIPYHSETVNFIYCSHFLEHLYLNEARKLIAEIYRVLKPGGRVRIVVPDLDHMVSLFNEGKTVEALKYFYEEKKVNEYTSHKYNYDYAILSNELLSAGFKQADKLGYKTGSLPDLEELETRKEGSLFVEAVR